MNKLVSKGKYLSWLLRHDKESFNKGLIDSNGYRKIEELVKNYNYTVSEIDEIVKSNNKQRYEYSPDLNSIRARQGHSIPVDVELKEAIITKENPYLYHGTSDRFINSIKRNGLLPQSRIYVHLSKDENTALTVGKRHGSKTCIIKINAYQMQLDGIKIYISNNVVYNTNKVDTKYFVEIK